MKKSVFLAAAFAVCALVRGQEASSEKGGAALESAKRELKEMPATIRPRELPGRVLGTNTLPSLELSTSSAPQPPPAAGEGGALSNNWLQEAMERTDQEGSPRIAPKATPSSGYKQVQDPFAPFMEQWLSRRDLELLYPDAGKNGALNPVAPVPAAPAESFPLAAPLPVAKNPYLDQAAEAPWQNGPQPLQPLASQSNADSARGLQPPPPAAAPGVRAPEPAKPAKPATEASPDSSRPPTAPIVDDRKYFPQLRRF